jgi:hypothetical protein
MKKLIAGAFALSMATSAMAAGTIGFEYGSSWFRPKLSANGAQLDWTAQGQTFAITWALDNDMWVGVYTEALNLNDGYGDTYPWSGQAIQVSKGIVKNVAVGLNIGTFYEAYYGAVGPLADVFGEVTLLSSNGDKISGSLKANAAARWANDTSAGGDDFSGYTVGIVAGLTF